MNTWIKTILITVVGALIIGYFNSSTPILFLESGCPSQFSLDKLNLNFQIRNRGDVEAYSTVCFESDQFILDYRNNNSKLCWPNNKFNPKSSELVNNFKIEPIPIFNKKDQPQNISITVSATCESKIWMLIPKDCDVLTQICKYQEEYSQYTLVK